jgi:toxin secretion/phage lysis holin
MKENITKGAIAFTATAISVYFKALFIPLIVLVAVMIIDYFTGLAKANYAAEISSKKGIKGIVKKVCYLVLVSVGIGVDFLITYTSGYLGINIGFKAFFSILISVWLIINELISILENIAKLGVPVPDFLTKIISKLRVSVETKGGNDDV